MERKVCIVANYSTTTNYGALLQAFALNKVINDMGVRAETLYMVNDPDGKKKNICAQLREARFLTLRRETKRFLLRLPVRRDIRPRKRVMNEFRLSIPHTEKYFKSQLHLLQERYDVFICGSDQIFRPNKYTDELTEHYWLPMVDNGAIKASYAASMGIDRYEEALTEQVRKYLADFDFISIREKSATEYLTRLTGRNDIVTSVDPVFLLDRDFWMEFAEPYPVGEDFIFVYMIRGKKELLQSIRAFSRMTGLKIVFFPAMASLYKSHEAHFGDVRIYDASPRQFLYLLQNARYVFTDSFHGTALSLILHVEHLLVSRANSSAFSRISDVLELLEAGPIAIPEDGLEPEEYLIERPTDWERADRIIRREREAAFSYLEQVINCRR